MPVSADRCIIEDDTIFVPQRACQVIAVVTDSDAECCAAAGSAANAATSKINTDFIFKNIIIISKLMEHH